MKNVSKESPSNRGGAPLVRAPMRVERGPGPSPVSVPNVAPRGSGVARRHRRARSVGTGSATGVPPALAGERLAALTAKLAMRISAWSWLRTYETWKRGEAVSLFQRRWLAFSMRRLRGELSEVSHAEFVTTAPWPMRGSDL